MEIGLRDSEFEACNTTLKVRFSLNLFWKDVYSIEPEKRLLVRAGVPVRLSHRPFQVLLFMVENRGRIVTREELLEKFWDGHEVYDEALTKCVGVIRKALGEQPDRARFIETRWAEGYRFIGAVEEEFCPPAATTLMVETETTRFVSTIDRAWEAATADPSPRHGAQL